MPRIRETLLINTPLTYYLTTRSDVGNYPATNNPLAYVFQHVKKKRIEDSVTPGYYSKVREGKFLPVNEVLIYTTEEDVIQPHSGSSVWTHTGTVTNAVTNHSGSYISNYTYNFPADYAPQSSDIDYVVIQALANAKSPDFDLLTFMGEFRQTVSLLGNTAGRIMGFAEGLAKRARKREIRRSRRNRQPYSFDRAQKDFFSLWLEARYGWRPLIYDMMSMMKALRHKNPSGIQRAAARHNVSISSTSTTSGTVTGSVSWNMVRTRSGTCNLRAVVFHQSDMSPIGMNPVITAWELTPYSFVIDWFIDIGSWLQAISPRVGYGQVGISVSWVADYTDDAVQTLSNAPTGNWVNGYGPMHLRKTMRKYHRFSYSSTPLPSIQVNLNAMKLLDLLGLVLQHQGRISRILRL